jgi:hypothetical protein
MSVKRGYIVQLYDSASIKATDFPSAKVIRLPTFKRSALLRRQSEDIQKQVVDAVYGYSEEEPTNVVLVGGYMHQYLSRLGNYNSQCQNLQQHFSGESLLCPDYIVSDCDSKIHELSEMPNCFFKQTKQCIDETIANDFISRRNVICFDSDDWIEYYWYSLSEQRWESENHNIDKQLMRPSFMIENAMAKLSHINSACRSRLRFEAFLTPEP